MNVRLRETCAQHATAVEEMRGAYGARTTAALQLPLLAPETRNQHVSVPFNCQTYESGNCRLRFRSPHGFIDPTAVSLATVNHFSL